MIKKTVKSVKKKTSSLYQKAKKTASSIKKKVCTSVKRVQKTAFSSLDASVNSGEEIAGSISDGIIDYMGNITAMGTGSIVDAIKGEVKNDKF